MRKQQFLKTLMLMCTSMQKLWDSCLSLQATQLGGVTAEVKDLTNTQTLCSRGCAVFIVYDIDPAVPLWFMVCYILQPFGNVQVHTVCQVELIMTLLHQQQDTYNMSRQLRGARILALPLYELGPA